MSNTYKNDLQSNNVNLQNILETIQNLPNSSDSSWETIDVTFLLEGSPSSVDRIEITYLTLNGDTPQLNTVTYSSLKENLSEGFATLQVIKNSIMIIYVDGYVDLVRAEIGTWFTANESFEGVLQYKIGDNLFTEDLRLKFYYACFIKGTLISCINKQYKKVEDISYEDELLVWDFDNGKFAFAKPLWIQKAKKATEYNKLVFSDGSTLCTINQHRIFNIEAGKFTYPMTDETPIGTHTLNNQGEVIKLISKEVIKEEVEYYNIITNYYINCFTNNILTSCRLSNLYPIQDFKYIKDNRELKFYKEFNEIPYEFYQGLRLSEQPAWEKLSNGAIDLGDKSYIDYVKRLIKDQK